jgi:exo-beta-1,3-glucanase (GH17 family)
VVVVTTVIKTTYAQATAGPNVIVYVDANGERTTMTEGMLENVPTPTPAPKPIDSPAPPPPAASKPPKNAAGPGGSSGSSPPPTSAGAGYGFSYAPFKSNGDCKDAAEVKRDFDAISNEYSLVRIYGVVCNQVETVLAAAQKHNMKIFAGIFDISQVEAEAKVIIDAGKKDWDRFDTISVGNEVVNFAPDDQKALKAGEVVAALAKAKTILRSGGFKGKIVTVDTLVAARAHPSICEASDYCAVNCHPFFDGKVAAGAAGKFLTEQLDTLSKAIPKGQKIVVTETGWPWQGRTNGIAVPSLENQEKALSSIKSAFRSNKSSVILFTIFNDHWKKNTAAQFNAEQYWGFQGRDAPAG